ncbi:hypothetical protein [Aminirod propionatiphilus]|uniref:Uncharacterized protein n=1 Tax=Aminirod propionatiphilus TaxID=3415223 RepID=A0ACD1DXR7_9BACT|nr:hypothetical protein KIH16_04350 [Synergistota bacterium]
MGSSLEEAISASIAEKTVPAILAALESRLSRERDEMRQAVAELALAVPIMNRFAKWAEGHEFQTAFEEESFVSEQYQFGGRIDWFGTMDGVPTLIDLKFTKALYPESTYQMSAYRHLLAERGIDVGRTKIVRFGRTEEEGFEEPELPEEVLETGWNVFLHLREIYALAKTLPKTGKAA